MAEQTYSIKFDAQAGPLVSGLAKVDRATRKAGQAQQFLNKISLNSAAAESPLSAIRAKTAADLAKLNKLLSQGAITSSQYTKAVKQLAATQKMQTMAMSSGIGAFKNMRGAMGMLGYQIQDVAVQLQMGQSAMLVFAQQGSQIASIFGPQGQVIGAIIAVAGALAMSFIPQMKETKQTADELLDEINNLRVGYNNLSAAAQTFYQVKLGQQIREQREEVSKLEKQLRKAKSDALVSEEGPADPLGIGQLASDTVVYTGEVKELSDENKLLNYELEQQRNKLKDLETGLKNLKKPTAEWMMSISESEAFVNDLAKKVREYGKTDLEILRENIKRLQPGNEELIDSLYRQYEALLQADNALKKYADSGKTLKEALIDVTAEGIEAMEDSLVDLISGTKSASAAFKDMARSIINDLIRMQIQSSITKPLAAAMNTFFTGTQTTGAPVVDHSIYSPAQKAIGGPVTRNTPYLVGEKGPELFIPNGSGSITKNSDLGGQGVTVVQNINVTTGVQQTVRTEIMGMMPQIATAAKGAVLDARRRGGSFAGAFG